MCCQHTVYAYHYRYSIRITIDTLLCISHGYMHITMDTLMHITMDTLRISPWILFRHITMNIVFMHHHRYHIPGSRIALQRTPTGSEKSTL